MLSQIQKQSQHQNQAIALSYHLSQMQEDQEELPDTQPFKLKVRNEKPW